MPVKRKPTPKTTSKPRTTKPKAIKTVKPTEIVLPDELTPQMYLFIDHYVVTMNGTRAAALAKYSGDDATLAATASRLLRNDKILRELNRRLEAYTMSANEVLIHLTDIARGDIADVLSNTGEIDPLEAKRRGKSHLIKRFKHKRKTITTTDSEGDNGSEILEDEHEIEMYDRLDALKTLAKFHSLLVDRVKIDDWRTEIIALLKDGKITPEQAEEDLGTDIAKELLESIGLSIPVAGEGGKA